MNGESPAALGVPIETTTLAPEDEADHDPTLDGIPEAVIANIGCYDTDCVGGCG